MILYAYKLYTLSFIIMPYGAVCLILSGFGFASYFYYKRTTNILIRKNPHKEPYSYCAYIGYRVALRRFNKRLCV